MAEIGVCKKCGSDDLEFKEGHYICKKCGEIVDLKEWSDILKNEKK